MINNPLYLADTPYWVTCYLRYQVTVTPAEGGAGQPQPALGERKVVSLGTQPVRWHILHACISIDIYVYVDVRTCLLPPACSRHVARTRVHTCTCTCTCARAVTWRVAPGLAHGIRLQRDAARFRLLGSAGGGALGQRQAALLERQRQGGASVLF